MNNNEEHKTKTLREETTEVAAQIEELENDPKVQEYIALLKRYEFLLAKREEIDKKKEADIYARCSHIFVKIDDGNNDFNTQRCVKCKMLSKKGMQHNALYTNIKCDFAFAQKLYNRFKADNPQDADAEIAWKMKAAIRELQERQASSEQTIKK